MGFYSFTDYIVNEKNLINNMSVIKSKLKSGVKLCAVVKANAYGVGSKIISNIVYNHVDCYAVANLEEGIILRNIGIDKEILVLGCMNFAYVDQYVYNFLTPTISTVCEMSKLSREVKSSFLVEFGLDTGMGRIGFSKKEEILTAKAIVSENKNIGLFGVFSHLATKENDINFMYKQKGRFDELLECFDCKNVVCHLSNTNAALNHQDFNYDMVRVGFGLYGMMESDGLKPVISVESRVVKINNVKMGESIGYDRTFVASKDMVVAVVPLGYYDGMGRGLSNKGRVVINGRFANVVGRVCMDMFMVDVSDIECVDVGTKVVVLGGEGESKITLSDHAGYSDTSEYEVLARINNSRMNVVIK